MKKLLTSTSETEQMAKKGKDCFLLAYLAPLHQQPKAYTADHKAVLHPRLTAHAHSWVYIKKMLGINR